MRQERILDVVLSSCDGPQDMLQRMSLEEFAIVFCPAMVYARGLALGEGRNRPRGRYRVVFQTRRRGFDQAGTRGGDVRHRGVFFTRRGRGEMKAMLPVPRDAADMAENLKYHTWRTKESPRFGRYDYSQKAEYWALIWGTGLMVLTGFVLWFSQEAVKFLPHWIVSASQTVHYYEAWLATLAIIVWHFFFVIFHPEEYPMSWTWLTGRMSKHFVKHHHRRWYEEEVVPGESGENQGEGEGATDQAASDDGAKPE